MNEQKAEEAVKQNETINELVKECYQLISSKIGTNEINESKKIEVHVLTTCALVAASMRTLFINPLNEIEKVKDIIKSFIEDYTIMMNASDKQNT